MTLDAESQPGSKRLPTLEIGDDGEATLELWCKGGKGRFSVAGNTVIFVAGPLEDRACPPARAQADDELVAALSEAATWRRQGDFVSFIGNKSLRFRLNTN
ncbi:META domain-containing protein [Bradyrhizobium sp.]|uniref:META domain-containing protein n=1 Tax=Bradyrhizobium sp. TaxID=376 RepID=UPI003C75F4A6